MTAILSGCKLTCISVVPGNRTRGNGSNLNHRKFLLNMEKNFLSVRVTEHRDRFPSEFVEPPSPEIFKSHLNTVLTNVL